MEVQNKKFLLLLEERIEKDKSETDYRSEYFRDYSRILHSFDFRKLQDKTQVYTSGHDVIRTRLTHSLEVANIANSIYLYLLNDKNVDIDMEIKESLKSLYDADLINAICISHDIGHPPYGHKGESELDKILSDLTLKQTRFEGNAQNIEILCKSYENLNLTKRTLLGVIKYGSQNDLITKEKDKSGKFKINYYTGNEFIREELLKDFESIKNFSFDTKILRTVDSIIMELADDIAYTTHDLQDAISYKLINLENDIEPIIKKYNLEEYLLKEVKSLETKRINYKKFRKNLIKYFITNLVVETKNINKASLEDIYFNLQIRIGKDNDDVAYKFYNELNSLYHVKYINSLQVQMSEYNAKDNIRLLFNAYRENLAFFPKNYQPVIGKMIIGINELIHKYFSSQIKIDEFNEKDINTGKLFKAYINVMKNLTNIAKFGINNKDPKIQIHIQNFFFELEKSKNNIYRFIANYISGMTDSYFIYVLERLIGNEKFSLKFGL